MSSSIPITFVMAIICQTVALVWFVSSLNSSIETNAREITRHETRIMALESMVQSQSITMARIDENIKSIRIMMEDIKNGKE
jgi:CII-binding regulator of phage lambda lysogenization HflD